MNKHFLITAFDFPPQWGGVATYSWELAQSLKKQGHQVTVVTRHSDSTQECDFEIIRYKLPHSGILAFPILTLQIIRLLRVKSFDHIFSTLWLPGGAAVCFALKILKKETPYSVTVHAMEIIDSNETLRKRFRGKLKFLKKDTFSKASSIFCVSHFTKELLLSHVPINENKIHVIHNGANPELFSPNNKITSSPYPTLVTACRLQANKGIDQVIKALPVIIKEFPELKYFVIGDGPDRQRLEQLVEMMKVSDSVHLLGKVESSALIDKFRQADLFVMLSRREKHFVEGFGLVFLEAALCGTPSLGGNSGGVPDAIFDNETGWLVDPHNSIAIEEKLLSLLRDKTRLQQVGAAACEKTRTERTWDHAVKKILTVIGS